MFIVMIVIYQKLSKYLNFNLVQFMWVLEVGRAIHKGSQDLII